MLWHHRYYDLKKISNINLSKSIDLFNNSKQKHLTNQQLQNVYEITIPLKVKDFVNQIVKAVFWIFVIY